MKISSDYWGWNGWMHVYAFPLWHVTHPQWVHSISSYFEDFLIVDFLITGLILNMLFVSGFFIVIPDLPIGKMSSKLEVSDAKFWMELYYCLRPIPSIPGFTCMARLPLGICCSSYVLCVIHSGRQIPQSGPSSLLCLVIVHMPLFYVLQNQTENIYTTLYIFEKVSVLSLQ